jgi:alkylated DNA repair protein (DNA oxidative demethylase)
MNLDLFSPEPAQSAEANTQWLSESAVIFRAKASLEAPFVLGEIQKVLERSPLRQMHTRSGKLIAVSMSNCGALGWVSDARGYRYEAQDPLTQQPWPSLPAQIHKLAAHAVREAGFAPLHAEACLINRYTLGVGMGLHQDRDEQDFTAPIVSLSFGLPATFLWGGLNRRDKTQTIILNHGDILVWGGTDRLRYHGIRPLKQGTPPPMTHPLINQARINCTLRQAR